MGVPVRKPIIIERHTHTKRKRERETATNQYELVERSEKKEQITIITTFAEHK